ncbi:hypothetical protein ABZT47_35565 [Sphaerisporangium sp. NPDC005289]|uniref:hypothetical protein n=1 Tax=Sphaerisporangium sp. NPDC005289 TaxID=3155247 RepID=UPI0033AAB5F1
MQWWQCAVCGAIGGALVEALNVFRWLSAWQEARRAATGRIKGRPPAMRAYLDLPAHAWLFVLRATLGAAAAMLFGMTGQISGQYVAIVLGFSAPSVLAQLGASSKVSAAVAGADPGSAPAPAREGLINEA